MIVPAPSREAVFVSENQMLADKPEIILKLNSDPRLLPVGYVRLAGIVNGVAPLALLDVVGRSVCLELNDELGGYRLVKIDGQAIYLRRL
ncbi:hypothetical protein HZB07_01495 [Candidatus Saganbacteria bacterium]|nr:hypothetical protein [Candidatus Saganbacteria bacterium]